MAGCFLFAGLFPLLSPNKHFGGSCGRGSDLVVTAADSRPLGRLDGPYFLGGGGVLGLAGPELTGNSQPKLFGLLLDQSSLGLKGFCSNRVSGSGQKKARKRGSWHGSFLKAASLHV